MASFGSVPLEAGGVSADELPTGSRMQVRISQLPRRGRGVCSRGNG